MPQPYRPHSWCTLLCGATVIAALAMTCLAPACAQEASSDAAALALRYQEILPQLRHNQFARPLYLQSDDTSSGSRSDIYAVVDYPFAQVRAGLTSAAQWCDVLILHLNTKYCRAANGVSPSSLSMRIGKKTEQAPEDASRLDFSYRVTAGSESYFDVRLNAGKGPFDTHDYRIRLEAIPVAPERSLLHLTVSYAFGMVSRMAMRTYLATIAGNKIGFTLETKEDGTTSHYVGGMRGTIERNAMRYYLAIDAYLSGLSRPPEQQLEHRLETWFDATERYPRQLHEIDKAAYLAMKRKEYAHQQAPGDAQASPH